MSEKTINSEFGALSPNPSNPRTITPDALAKLTESIGRDPQFMLLRPVVIGPDGDVLGGNQRLTACIAMGMTDMPVGWVARADDLSPEQARRFVLVDNAPDGMSGSWDDDALARDYGFAELEGLGFDLDDLRAFDDIGKIDQDEAPDIAPGAPESAGDAFVGVVNDPDEVQFLLDDAAKRPHMRIWDKMLPGQSGDDITGKNHFSLQKLDPARPSPTITKFEENTGVGGIMHWAERRKVTVAEAKRLSSFPDDFKFAGSREDAMARMGNCVPPLLMKAIAAHIKKEVLHE